MVDSGALPDGAVQLVCGSLGDAFDHLTGQDSVFFTGSAATATKLRSHPVVLAQSVRFTAEADSLNASVLGPAAVPGTAEFDLYVKEVAREMTTKAGQRCTAIRRALVPAGLVDDVVSALADRLAKVVVGDPRREEVRMGPLVSLDQRLEVERAVATLAGGAEVAVGGPDGKLEPLGGDRDRGAFLAPTVLVARDAAASAVHDVEPFGPVCTVLPYDGVDEAVDLARLGKGSLVVSVFTPDAAEAGRLALGLGAHHGRVLRGRRAVRQDPDGPRLPHAPPRPRRARPGRRRRGAGRHPVGPPPPAAGGGAGFARHAVGPHRHVPARRHPEGGRPPPVHQALRGPGGRRLADEREADRSRSTTSTASPT